MRPRGVDGGSEEQNGEKRERGGCRENRNIYIYVTLIAFL